MIKLNERKKGVAIVYLAIIIAVLLLFAAIVIDVGMIALNKSKLQNAADAAALAGAKELPTSKANASTQAINYAKDNGVEHKVVKDSEGNDVVVEDVSTSFPSDRKIEVTVWRNVNFFFARIISGNNFVKDTAKASAVNAAPNKINRGLRPLAIPLDDVVEDTLKDLKTLKVGAGLSYSGNFGAVVLDNRGGSEYEDTLKYGSDLIYHTGDQIDTLPGDKVGPTKQGVQYIINSCPHTPKCTADSYKLDCPRLIIVPLVDTIDVTGTKKITIMGFAEFFVEDVVKGVITGKFIRKVPDGEIDPSGQQPEGDYWLTTVKLVD